MALSKSQINKLGERLRHQQTIDPESLDRLQELRSLYDPPLAQVQARIKEALGLDATSRLKTVNTIIEKLTREKMRLAEMQDIAGLRIVEQTGLGDQDQMVQRIGALFPAARIVDRRKQPSHGYRAVHVIPEVDGRLVEIQVRTRLQDLWAQSMERLADEAGREVRYGGIPKGWQDAVQGSLSLSDSLREVEEYIESIRVERSRLPLPHHVSHGQRELQLLRARYDAHLQSLESSIKEVADRIRDRLRELAEGKPNA